MGRLIPLETVMTTRATVVLKMHCSLCTSVRGSQSTGRLIRVQYSACINFVVECINFTVECTNFVQQSASQIGTQKFGGGLDREMVNCRAIRPPLQRIRVIFKISTFIKRLTPMCMKCAFTVFLGTLLVDVYRAKNEHFASFFRNKAPM